MTTKNVSPKTVLVGKLQTSLKNINDDVTPVIDRMMADVGSAKIQPAGPIEFIYLGATDDVEKVFDLQVAIPVNEGDSIYSEEFQVEQTREFKCTTDMYKGSMNHIYGKYEEMYGQIQKEQLHPNDEIREVYNNWVSFSSEENEVEIQIGLN